MKHIYFNCAKQFAQYPQLEEKLEQLMNGEKSSKEEARLCVEICKDIINKHDDFLTCLGIIYNYYPSRYHYNDDYEQTTFLISALAKGWIDERTFESKTGLGL